MIRATTRPRRSAGARSAAKGIMTWPGDRGGSHGHRRQAEDPDVGGEGARDQGDGRHAEDAHHQDPTDVQVAQRDDEQEPGRRSRPAWR